jgi:hypothetical protein
MRTASTETTDLGLGVRPDFPNLEPGVPLMRLIWDNVLYPKQCAGVHAARGWRAKGGKNSTTDKKRIEPRRLRDLARSSPAYRESLADRNQAFGVAARRTNDVGVVAPCRPGARNGSRVRCGVLTRRRQDLTAPRRDPWNDSRLSRAHRNLAAITATDEAQPMNSL